MGQPRPQTPLQSEDFYCHYSWGLFFLFSIRFTSDLQFSSAFESCHGDPNHCIWLFLVRSALCPPSSTPLSSILIPSSECSSFSVFLLIFKSRHSPKSPSCGVGCLHYCASLKFFFFILAPFTWDL